MGYVCCGTQLKEDKTWPARQRPEVTPPLPTLLAHLTMRDAPASPPEAAKTRDYGSLKPPKKCLSPKGLAPPALTIWSMKQDSPAARSTPTSTPSNESSSTCLNACA